MIIELVNITHLVGLMSPGELSQLVTGRVRVRIATGPWIIGVDSVAVGVGAAAHVDASMSSVLNDTTA